MSLNLLELEDLGNMVSSRAQQLQRATATEEEVRQWEIELRLTVELLAEAAGVKNDSK